MDTDSDAAWESVLTPVLTTPLAVSTVRDSHLFIHTILREGWVSLGFS